MPLPTDPKQRQKAAAAVARVMSLPPKDRRRALAKAKALQQSRGQPD
jgi:hypothetical protein